MRIPARIPAAIIAGGAGRRMGGVDKALLEGFVAGCAATGQIERLRDDETPLAHLARVLPQARPQALREWLAGFGFTGEQVARVAKAVLARLA